jgi:hypothetical protein
MDNSHGKEIVLGRTTVKIPGGRPRGSEAPRTCPKTSANGHLVGVEALSTGNSRNNWLCLLFVAVLNVTWLLLYVTLLELYSSEIIDGTDQFDCICGLITDCTRDRKLINLCYLAPERSAPHIVIPA